MTDRPARRLSPLTPVVRSFIVLVAAGATVLRDLTRGDLGPTAIMFGLLLVGGALYGTASWLRTWFWIEADELRVDTGVISRQSRRIRIDRLQGVDIVQPFVARLFGLAELRMDVAGGGSREGSLAYLPLSEARRLKDLLLARRDEIGQARPGSRPGSDAASDAGSGAGGGAGGVPGAGPGAGPGVGPVIGPGLPGTAAPGRPGDAPEQLRPAGEGGAPPATAAPPAPPPERLLARVDLKMLVLSAMLSGETIMVVIAGMVMLGMLAAGLGFATSASLPAVLGFGIAAARRVYTNYRFTVSETPAGLQVRRGLFELSAQTIALHRVQGVVVSEPLLWRPFGWARLDVSIAGYGNASEGEGSAPSTVLPVGEVATVRALARHVLADQEHENVELRPVPHRARWAAPVAHRFLRVGTSERLIVSRGGWPTRRTHVAPQARIQSLRITQGPWQRWLGLADVHADSPSGPTQVSAHHRDAAEARRLFDVEVAMTAWARRQHGAG